MRRLALLLTLAAAGLATAPGAAASLVTADDGAGRTITFDLQAPGVDVEWYANHLRRAAHGDEIERVVVRIVPQAEIRRRCGPGAAGCYGGSALAARIVVPAGHSPQVAHTLLHEYAHHVDRNRGVGAAKAEPNGSASWWKARGIGRLLAAGQVSHTYSLGWDRAIGELFAEDYAQLHLETPFKISWLGYPGAAVRAALRRDLENVPAEPLPAEPRPPAVITRTGSLARGQVVTVPFELIGRDRRVTFSATVTRATAARVELRCTHGARVTRVLGGASRTTKVDLKGLGPARCTLTLRGTGVRPGGFNLRLRLAIERPAT
jgi:hypothetical protein